MKSKYLIYILLIGVAFGCSKVGEGDEPGTEPIDNPVGPVDPVNPVDKSALPTVGDFNYLVVLVETSDVHFSIENPRQSFSDMLNRSGYDSYGGTGSARDYFKDQSSGQFNPTFDVYGPVQVDMAMSNFTVGYGLTKLGGARLFAMACDKLDSEVDYSKYDSNGDGVIDNIFFFYAGYNSAEGPDNAIWPHAGVVEYKSWKFDGLKLEDYSCTSELKGSEGVNMCRIGNFCHEFAHILGLPDLYDAISGKADGLGDFSLMHSGCYNNNGNTPPSLNCEERMMLGWLEDIPSLPGEGSSLSISPISSNVAYKSETTNPGEYFDYEYRNGEGWDAFVPKGLVIYHIDKSQNEVNGKTAAVRWKYLYDLNGYPSHECFDLVKASDECAVFGYEVKEFTPISWSGEVQSPMLSNISIGSAAVSLDIR